MSNYKRLTKKKLRDTDLSIVLDEHNNVIVDRRLFEKFIKQHNRLAELEDKIENGTLIELKEPHIVKNEGSVCYEVWWQEAINRFDWFDTKEEAEKKLKELQNG